MALTISICDLCGGAVAALVKTCYACDSANDQVAATASRSGGGLDATSTVLTVLDFAVLERFVRLQLPSDGPAARALLGKLHGSRIVRVDAVGSDVATLGSRVVFAVDGSQPQARVLVLSTRHAAAGWTLPVTAPRGLALLGRAAGDVVAAARRDGTAERLHLLDVLQQPEAAAAAAMRDEGGRPRGIAAAVGEAEAVGTGSTCLPARRLALYRFLGRTWPVALQRLKDGSIGER